MKIIRFVPFSILSLGIAYLCNCFFWIMLYAGSNGWVKWWIYDWGVQLGLPESPYHDSEGIITTWWSETITWIPAVFLFLLFFTIMEIMYQRSK